MTIQKIDLAMAFLKSQPGAAASILEQQPAERVAAFLKDAPPKLAAAVLGKMLPQYTSRLCKALEPSITAGFLLEMETSLVVEILRRSGNETRKQLLDLLPEKTKIACKLLLKYSEASVGAWMVTHISGLPVDCTVEEALSRLASEHDVVDMNTAHVIDREKRLQGMVSVARLLRAQPNAPLTEILEKAPEPISGRTALVSAKNHPGWTRGDAIPVINRHHHLVGVLRHVDLRKGLEQIATTIAQPSGGDPITGICEVYGGALLALFNSAGEFASAKNPDRE